MKKLLPFFLLLSFFLTPTFAFASAARELALVDKALSSNANTALRDVRVMNGTVTAVVDQQVALNGSSAILSQPVSFAADYAAVARSAAGLATKVAGGYALVAGAQFALQKLLDGVGYVMDPVAQSIKKPVVITDACQMTASSPCPASSHYVYRTASSTLNYYYSTADIACKNTYLFDPNSFYAGWYGVYSASNNICTLYDNKGGGRGSISVLSYSNPNYNSNSQPPFQVQTQQQVQDAFLTWMQNNPTSVTDPIVQKMYTPAQTSGWNLTGAEGAHFGNDGISDEMAKNILANRDAALQKPKSYTLNDSAQTATQVTPDGAAETNTTNPDGSKTKKTTVTTTDPNTGKQTTTTTTVVTQPDGTTQTSTQTTTTDATKTKTDIPAACEWFSTACDWFGWTKKDDPIIDDPQIDQSDLPTPTLSENAISWGSQCPNPQLINFNLMGQTANIQLSWTPVCTLLSYLYYPILACAYISACYIVIGAYKS